MNKLFLITFLMGYFSFAQTYEIPVVFHIITHPDKDISVVKKVHFNELINTLNSRFNNPIKGNIATDFHKDIGFPNIQFRLADKDKYNKTIKAITYNNINYKKLGVVSVPWLDLDAKRLRKIIQYDTNNYLNIYFTNIGDKIDEPAGHYSELIDSLIMDIDELTYIANDPFLLIHEIGHYLGLLHIWGKDVNPNYPFKDGCDYDDEVIDTPPQEKPHFKDYVIVQDSCGGLGKTNHQNFMDYSYDTGMFTKKQVIKMRSNIKFFRNNLLWKPTTVYSTNSILSKTKQRDKLGAPFNFNQRLPYNTNIDLTLKGLIEKELKIDFNADNLQKLGLKITGTDKFQDYTTGKTVSQDYIYKYLDIEKAKLLVNKLNPQNVINTNGTNTDLSIGIENRRQEKLKLVLKNKQTNQEYTFDVDKVYRTYTTANSVKVLWVKLPQGNYSSKVYTLPEKTLISSTDLILNENNQLVTIKAN